MGGPEFLAPPGELGSTILGHEAIASLSIGVSTSYHDLHDG